ncbi:NAD(P)H dehydrogenase (quinone) [Methylobacterium sp. UNC378MF]|uniref:NAD(P)H-dependent oxidoreductase n=1 Tax=Methylobacterium sp. UNC378MF TaxID=1502748 RepID=UPI00088B1918|nr:NAD(P)H-dependent oxidoreductase [Methylobacterium sp. UNC378MF]SDA33588.1 NAD(P)H dehydrogenase (quinone) [Methylobacterium sp. UNC378MF]
MKILVVSAHPEPASLTNALRDVAVAELQAAGHAVRVTDLYAIGWKSEVNRRDFPTLSAFTRLRVPAASSEAFVAGSLTKDVIAAQDDLLWADALILAFPLWWFSMPAILKGWIDRVYAFGFAYGVGEHSETRWGDRYGEGTLAGKRAMLIVTAGGWPTHYGPRGINGPIDDLLFPIHHGVLFYPGYDVLPPFVLFRADRTDEATFDATATALKGRMRTLFETPPIPFRRQNGGDYAIPSMELRPERVRPDLAGFAAHVEPPALKDRQVEGLS